RLRRVVHGSGGVAPPSPALARVWRGRGGEQPGVAPRGLSPPATPPWGWGRRCCAPRGAVVEGLGRMRETAHVRFLGGGRAARLSSYPTVPCSKRNGDERAEAL